MLRFKFPWIMTEKDFKQTFYLNQQSFGIFRYLVILLLSSTIVILD